VYIKKFYRLDTKYGCGGVIVSQGGLILETCPLYRWMSGKPFREVLASLKKSKKLYSCHRLSDEYDPF
jgi:hypothetical protein